ncbi:MAG: hypothetical protein V4568_14235 [Pseudomonadota bacterium]
MNSTKLQLFNNRWPIVSNNYQEPSAKVLSSQIENSICGSGTVIKNAKVRNSVLHRGVIIEDGAELDECVVMDYVRIKRGARLRRAIIGLHNIIESNTKVGYDYQTDAQQFSVSDSGIVIIPDAHPAGNLHEQLREVAISV